MRKFLALTAALFLSAGVVYGNFCAKDYVPAATLLVPYVIVDADANGDPDPAGYTTLLTVTNVSRTRQVIHVTVWSAVSEAIVDFSEVLSGYDVWSINFRDLLTGRFDLFDTYAPGNGFHSGPLGPNVEPFGPSRNRTNAPPFLPGSEDIGRPGEAPFAGPGCPPHGSKITPGIIGFIRNGITGPLKAYDQVGNCGALTPPDGPTWLKTLGNYPYFFYVTVDTVTNCTLNFPTAPDYWTTDAANNNVLIGQIFYLNFNANYSESLPAVSIEADFDWAGTAVGFYEGLFANDFHEPLGSAYAINFFTQGGLSTELIVWKEFADLVAGDVNGCRGFIYYAWDEDEHFMSSTESGGISGSPPPTGHDNTLPFETQKVPVNKNNFNALPDANGWLLLVFDRTNTILNSPYPRDAQAYVAAKYNYGAYSTALEAALMANTHCFATQVLPVFNTYVGAQDGALVR